MYDSRYKPRLNLQRTVSHPCEDVRVIGFRGRDKAYGRNAMVLNASEVPTHEGVFAIPEEVYRAMDEDHYALYVLAEDTVYAAPSKSVQQMESRLFETDYGNLQFQSLTEDEFFVYDRDNVEVDNE